MTIVEVEMRVRERQAQFLTEVENEHLLHLAFQRRTWRGRIADALYALGQKFDPQRQVLRTPTPRAVPCQEC
ncbi:MAG: hypothetical protein HC933_08770 [Pleurocapsa sp. SU_196_0]|nr:hypothetical protein [Pleurocapsa sp. SU_196_0]